LIDIYAERCGCCMTIVNATLSSVYIYGCVIGKFVERCSLVL